jgi:hypothetical protein
MTAVVLCLLSNQTSVADELETSNDEIVFEQNAAAIITARCVRCHNPEDRKAGIDLSTPKGILAGGESGRIIQPGQPEESLLFQMIDAGEMPPEGKDLLNPSQLETIQTWISAGAKFRDAHDSEPAVTQHDILPLFYLRCVACHGGRRKEADLDLRTRKSILKGGKSGPAAIPGKPSESLVIRRLLAEEMPPRRKLVSVSVKPMETSEIEKLTTWIGLGLPESTVKTTDLELSESLVTDEDRTFWSFQKPRRPSVPEVSSADRVRNPIDAFVLQKLEEGGLTLSPEADKTTLLRRVHFDLIGLPPSPGQIDDFLNDRNPQAYEDVVNRLLKSPQYGERWGRHWLDAAGYADSEGAQNEDRVRPHMYRYRDYVIRSLNSDKPYSQFLVEQIAGDELVDFEHADVIDNQIYDNLVATGFLRTAPDRTFADITNFVPDRLEVIADEIDILGTAVMGLTLKCARCHFHKFDPIPQQDYYRLTAIFKDAYDEHDWLKSQGPRTLPNVTTAERNAWEKSEQKITQQVEQLRTEQMQKTVVKRKELLKETLASLPADIREKVNAALKTSKSERTDDQNKLIAEHASTSTMTAEDFGRLDAQFKTDTEARQQQIKEVESQRRSEPRIRALWSRGEPSPSFVLKRGNYLTPGRPVDPGVPAVLSDSSAPFEVQPPWKNATATGRRLAFARWLTRSDHPLTARVMVNRMWQHHFGAGIVTTPGNFGKAGAKPSHPELLDWLATEFVDGDWKLKSLHRLIVTSAAYRQSSHVTDDALRLDPDGILLSRMPLKRLEAEVLRDTLLFVAGALDDTPFGPADAVELRADGLVTTKSTGRGWRRSIYVLQRRTQIPTLLDNFDYPQMGPNCVQRRESLVAPQALHLMNNGMIYQLAERFADRVIAEAGENRAAQVERAYLMAFGRRPSLEETAAAVSALNELTQQWTRQISGDDSKANPARRALVTWCHAVFNLAEFQYVD